MRTCRALFALDGARFRMSPDNPEMRIRQIRSARGILPTRVYYCMRKRSRQALYRWITGHSPLWFVCWVTGVIPYMLLLQIHLSAHTFYFEKQISLPTENRIQLIIEFLFLIYTPVCLVAIANTAIQYENFHLWCFFAFLLFAKGGEIYFNFLMGKWPFG